MTSRRDFLTHTLTTAGSAALAGSLPSMANATLGAERVQVVPEPTMGGEDFSYYAKKVPSVFFVLGLKRPGETNPPTLHQPEFDFNDDALATGIEMMVALATN